MRKTYKTPRLEIELFEETDVIFASDGDDNIDDPDDENGEGGE